jgi:hypothetical protein
MQQIKFSDANLHRLIVHYVGNPSLDQSLVLSENPIVLNDTALVEVLKRFFLNPFKQPEFFHFHHLSDLNLNEVYHYCNTIFNDPTQFVHISTLIASHLYQYSNHPKIMGGELYITLFEDCFINDENVSAIGIFKSENKDTFLKLNRSGDQYHISADSGVNINRLDKGALIFNTEHENGFLVCSIDQTNKNNDAQYWRERFLNIKPKKDNFFHTDNYLKLAAEFIKTKMKDEFEVTKADEADLLNKSINYFKQNDNFSFDTFASEVMTQREVVEQFQSFKKEYEQKNDFIIAEEFEINEYAVKKQTKVYKSVLKLDKNFHVYIHGNRNMIDKGIDQEKGLKFYKLYYNEES